MVVITIFYQAWNLSPATVSLIPQHKNMIHCIILTNEADFKLPFLDVQIKTAKFAVYRPTYTAYAPYKRFPY